MRVLEFIGLIKLPDDFKGTEDDALRWYLNYKETKKIERIDGDTDKDVSEANMPYSSRICDFMNSMSNLIRTKSKTRGGIYQITDI